MREVERVLEYGTIEKRYYDESGKLVDIRKIPPPLQTKIKHFAHRAPGAFGGHERET